MLRLSQIAGSVALLAGFALAWPALAADPPHGGWTGGSPGGGSGPHGGMPAHGFHGAPPGFHGALPHGGAGHNFNGTYFGRGGPGHDMGRFHGHDFGSFTSDERGAWQGGAWRHAWHNGHYGWWWSVGDLWFFYPGPIYPYPDYVGPDTYYDYYDQNGAPGYYWYHCEDPPGYYPYVQQCNGPWEPVPPYGQ